MLSGKEPLGNVEEADELYLHNSGASENRTVDETAQHHEDEYPPSLIEDIQALYEDGTAYIEAEVSYQKTRVAFVASKTGSVAAYGFGVLAFLHLALIALVVGSLVALLPLVGAWGATGIVVGTLLVLAGIMGFIMRKKISGLTSVFGDKSADGAPS